MTDSNWKLPDQAWFSTTEVQQLTQLTRSHVYGAITDGTLTTRQLGPHKQHLVSYESLAALMDILFPPAPAERRSA